VEKCIINGFFRKDRFFLWRNDEKIYINEKDIVWEYEKQMYKSANNSENLQWINPSNGSVYYFY